MKYLVVLVTPLAVASVALALPVSRFSDAGVECPTDAFQPDTIVVRPMQGIAPEIDGIMRPLEWAASIEYDISDILGRAGTPQPAGTVFACYLYDEPESLAYFAVDCPTYTTRLDYDQYGL